MAAPDDPTSPEYPDDERRVSVRIYEIARQRRLDAEAWSEQDAAEMHARLERGRRWRRRGNRILRWALNLCGLALSGFALTGAVPPEVRSALLWIGKMICGMTAGAG